MKIVLVFPRYSNKKVRHTFPPLGVLYLSSYLNKYNIQTKIIDCIAENLSIEETVKLILNENPDYLGFSIMTCQLENAINISKKIKQLNNNIITICGGPHISSTREEIFQFTDTFNFAVYGEGEETLYELLMGLPKHKIKGLIYNEKKIKINPPREMITDLDKLPFPDLNQVNVKNYHSAYTLNQNLTTMITMRGCPFNCSFCDVFVTHGRGIRMRGAKNVVDEIEFNKNRFKINNIIFKDSTFTVNKQHVYEICEEMNKRNLNIKWTCNTRADMVDDEILKKMRDSGCYLINFGIESGDQEVLDAYCKGVTLKQIEEAVKLCNRNRIKANGCFMFGNTKETPKKAQNTIDFAKKLNLDFVSFYVTTAYPNTPIYKQALDDNVIDEYWYMKPQKGGIMIHSRGVLNYPNFSPEQQVKFMKKATKAFYIRPKYIIKTFLSIRSFKDIRRIINGFLDVISF